MKEKKYWVDITDFEKNTLNEAQGELSETGDIPIAEMDRRHFVKVLGISGAMLSLAGCSGAAKKTIPLLKQPPEQTPGVASFYSSTCDACPSHCGIIMKVRDGRPIKLEGNIEHPMNSGGLCASGQASVIGLYHDSRLKEPMVKGQPANWDEIDRQIIERLGAVKKSGRKVVFLSSTIGSPTSKMVIDEFLKSFPVSEHVIYDPISLNSIRKAHEITHKIPLIPHYRIDKCDMVVSIGADFLGTWLSPVEFASQYAKQRNPSVGKMLKHIQIESRMSLTGSNADERVLLLPSQIYPAIHLIAGCISERIKPGITIQKPIYKNLKGDMQSKLMNIAELLVQNKGRTLIISDINNLKIQILINIINNMLDNYENSIEISRQSYQNEGDESRFISFIDEMKKGSVGALMVYGANPAYDNPLSSDFLSGLGGVDIAISLNSNKDETGNYFEFICPSSHFLESWNDYEPYDGLLSLSQPGINPILRTRVYQESLMKWGGKPMAFYDKLRMEWRNKYFLLQKKYSIFDDFWDSALEKGCLLLEKEKEASPIFSDSLIPYSVENSVDSNDIEAVLYEKISIRDGRNSHNSFLQELPDPVTKVSWDNYISVSSKMAKDMGIKDSQMAVISYNNNHIELPVRIQPGQCDGSIAMAVGYGRTIGLPDGKMVGANLYPFVNTSNGFFDYYLKGIKIKKTDRFSPLAISQPQSSLEGRDIVKEISLPHFLKGKIKEKSNKEEPSIWSGHKYQGHKWGMIIDTNACIGCNGCVMACEIENNIPVVGKDEVRRRREMHWLRIDRYYEGAQENPKTLFQPMLCQQCDNASCESVCPVLATVHSTEGLSMQVYNRCVGTRYCANNCPYKVRRFNWFLYRHDNPLANLALNPDVTVRSRGVMEKCSFCVQRIEAVKIRTKNENRLIKDGEIQPACAESCPADAIIFGDINDKESRVCKLKEDIRSYRVLEELNLQPSIYYLAKVRNDGESA